MKQGDNVTKTEKAIQQMETWARDDSHGYDQRYRWGVDMRNGRKTGVVKDGRRILPATTSSNGYMVINSR